MFDIFHYTFYWAAEIQLQRVNKLNGHSTEVQRPPHLQDVVNHQINLQHTTRSRQHNVRPDGQNTIRKIKHNETYVNSNNLLTNKLFSGTLTLTYCIYATTS